LASAIVGRTFSVQVAKLTIREECVVKWKNSQILTDSLDWFGANSLADDRLWHRSSRMGTTTVKNGQASRTRLFEA